MLAVRSFPVITPHLDILQCIKAMAKRGEKTVEEIIANHQMVSLSLLNEAEKTGLMRFLLEQNQQGARSMAYKNISGSQWQAMLNEK